MHDSNEPMDEAVQRLLAMLTDPDWHNDTRICGTMLLMSDQLKSRPEVDAVEPELEANGYAAVPSWRGDGRWESWGRIGNITSGPEGTFPTCEAALEAGRAWRVTQAAIETMNPAEAGLSSFLPFREF